MLLLFGAVGVAGVQPVGVGVGAGVPNCYPEAGYAWEGQVGSPPPKYFNKFLAPSQTDNVLEVY